jgi:hypothetical protein
MYNTNIKVWRFLMDLMGTSDPSDFILRQGPGRKHFHKGLITSWKWPCLSSQLLRKLTFLIGKKGFLPRKLIFLIWNKGFPFSRYFSKTSQSQHQELCDKQQQDALPS